MILVERLAWAPWEGESGTCTRALETHPKGTNFLEHWRYEILLGVATSLMDDA